MQNKMTYVISINKGKLSINIFTIEPTPFETLVSISGIGKNTRRLIKRKGIKVEMTNTFSYNLFHV